MAIIVGATIGIGETTGHLFASKHGAEFLVAVVQNTKTLVKELCNIFEFIQRDVRNEMHVATTMDKGSAYLPPQPSILGAVGPIDETCMAEFGNTMAINIGGAFLCVEDVACVMKPTMKGFIICRGNMAGTVGGLGPHAYTIIKMALVGLVRSTSVEL